MDSDEAHSFVQLVTTPHHTSRGRHCAALFFCPFQARYGAQAFRLGIGIPRQYVRALGPVRGAFRGILAA